MNHFIATYIDLIQSVGSLVIFFILALVLRQVTLNKDDSIEKVKI